MQCLTNENLKFSGNDQDIIFTLIEFFRLKLKTVNCFKNKRLQRSKCALKSKLQFKEF